MSRKWWNGFRPAKGGLIQRERWPRVFGWMGWTAAVLIALLAMPFGASPVFGTAAVAPSAQSKGRAPFRSGTRQRRAKVGVVAYAAASSLTPLELPRVGMLSRIIVQFRGTVTLSGAGALTDLGPWNLASRLKVNANIGSAALYDVSGYGTYMIQHWAEEMAYRPDNAGAGATTPHADIHAAPVAMGANTWVLTYIIPIGANAGKQFDLGLINLQAPETRVTVEITTGALLDPATLVTATTGNFHVYYEYYEIPDPNQFALPPLALVRTIEEQQPIGQTGDNVYTVPRQGILLQLAQRVTLNGARGPDASVDSFSIKFNKTDSVYVMERQWERVLNRLFFGMVPLTGVYCWDFWHAESDVSAGDTRDAIDAEELSTLEAVVTVASGAVLGSNNNFLASVRRFVQLLQ